MATEDLEDLIKDDSFLSFDPDCVRKRANWSKASDAFKFDSGKFEPQELLNAIPERSPKLQTLLQKIEQLDRADMTQDGHLYKHFIFCDLKSSTYGAKLLASALLAKGMTLGYDAPLGGRAASNKSLSPNISSPKQFSRRKKPRKQSSPKRLSPTTRRNREKELTMITPTAEMKTIELPPPPPPTLETEILEPSSPTSEPEILEPIPPSPIEEPEEELEPPSPGTELNTSENSSENELAEGEEQEGEEQEGEEQEDEGEAEVEQFEEQKGGAGKKTKIFGKIQVLSDRMLNSNPNNNFFLLSSVTVFDQPISVATKKQILQKFNQRPENVFGQEARIIVMDSGFKEGIDLFDIKYIHIFEPPVNAADQKQVIGRGTRLCGQKGLVFHPTQGWPLHVFVYDLDIPDKMQSSFLGATTAFDLYLKAMNLDIRLFRFAADLEETSIYGSVDYELNRKIHDFVIAGNTSPKQSIPAAAGGGGAVKMSGGGPKKARLIIDRTMPPIMVSTKGDSLTLMGSESSLQLQVRLPSGQLISGVELKQMNFSEMRKYIKHYFGDLSWSDVQMENMCIDKTAVKGSPPKQKGGASTVIKYTPTQDFVRRYFTPQAPVKGMLLWHSVGTGKCHAKNTPIIMFDGSIKMVQDIIVGDKLMGDDSTPREVLSLAQGQDEMYDIIPTKGDKYTVNSEHILCLKFSGKGSISYLPRVHKVNPYVARHFDKNTRLFKFKRCSTREEAEQFLTTFTENDKYIEIEVKDFLKMSKSSQRELKGYRVGVEFPSKPVEFDPYILGAWLGDGTSRDPKISSQDSKILKYLTQRLPDYGLRLVYESQYDYRFSCNDTTRENSFMRFMRKYNLVNNKHIPTIYKYNDRHVRLNVLAGLLDTDGYYCTKGKVFSITQKSNVLTEDILYLVRSLGYAAYSKKSQKSCMYKGEKKTGWYNTINISGDGLDEIPTLLTRKRAEKRCQKKNAQLSGIKVISIGKGDYYGFTLNGNNRYLLGDFTVTHNTCSAIAAASSAFEPQNYTILWVTRTTLKNDIWKNMFDQICSEVMKRKLEELEQQGLSMPEVQAKRMRLLSKNWSIRPMSYKQFSNLVSKENNFYKALVKINGPADPLRKTLLVIDEAHKLYGGGDLSSLERPDMKALHAALMNSYAISGPDSVRLLLMTATPITENPMELIKLMNLCKLPDQQMPTDFPLFSQEFLDEEGGFTAEGRRKYLDAIAGHISYLNREKDARQFSQPRIQAVRSPLIRDVQDAMDLDKRFARSILNKEVDDLKDQVKAENDKIDADLKDLDASRFYSLRDKCDDLEGGEKKACLKIANANIRQLIQEVKAHTGQIKDAVKEIKEEVKNKNLFRKNTLKNISDRLKDNPQQLEKFREGMFYSLKYKCGKKITPNTALKEAAVAHPDLIGINREIDAYGERLAKLDQGLKSRLLEHNNQIKSIKQMLRTGNLNELERGVLKLSLKDIRKTFTQRSKVANKLAEEERKYINTTRKALEKNRKHQLNSLKKTFKGQVKEQKSEAKDTEKAATKLRKTMRKQGELREEIKHELLLDLMKKYSGKVDADFINMKADVAAKVEEGRMKKAAKTEEKAKMKEAKMAAKQEEKTVKLVAKQAEKAKMKEAKALDRADAKEAIKLARETRKAADKAAKMVEKLKEKAKKAEAKKDARRTKKNRDSKD